jgi:adenosylcobinamide-GDP ribazoletransferase
VGDGLRLALTTFTVAPLRPGRVDRAVAGVAMALAPAVGLVLGVVLGSVGLLVRWLGGGPLLAGAVTVALGALLTRALHLDGLADTVDGLGSYRDPAGALAVMKRPDVGPFGVVAIVVALLVQAVCAASVVGRAPWAALAGIAAATGTGRLAVTWACRRGVPAARPDGLGALVAGSVGWTAVAAGSAVVAAVGLAGVPGRPWQGVVAVGGGVAVAVALTRHAVRRFGGITGDVLGACVEVAATCAYLFLALGAG